MEPAALNVRPIFGKSPAPSAKSSFILIIRYVSFCGDSGVKKEKVFPKINGSVIQNIQTSAGVNDPVNFNQIIFNNIG
jgi:hypothetical protein